MEPLSHRVNSFKGHAAPHECHTTSSLTDRSSCTTASPCTAQAWSETQTLSPIIYCQAYLSTLSSSTLLASSSKASGSYRTWRTRKRLLPTTGDCCQYHNSACVYLSSSYTSPNSAVRPVMGPPARVRAVPDLRARPSARDPAECGRHSLSYLQV